MPVVEQAESTVHIFGKLLLCAPNGAIIAIILRQAVQPGGQRRQHFRSFSPIFQLLFNNRERIIKVHTLWIGTRSIVRGIIEAAINKPRQLPTLILWDFSDSVLTRIPLLRDQALILLDNIGNGQMNGIIFFEIVVALIFQTLVCFRTLVSGATAAAVLSKAGFDKFLMLLRCMGIAEVGIYGQSAIQMVAEEKAVNLVLRDEHFALPQEIRLCGEVALRQVQTVQHNADAMGVIVRQAETQDVPIHGISVEERMVLLCQRLQSTLCLCERDHVLVQFRVALVLVVDGQSLREQPHVPAFLGQVAGCHQKRVHRFVQYLVRGLLQFGGGEIDPGPQQPQNAARRQSP